MALLFFSLPCRVDNAINFVSIFSLSCVSPESTITRLATIRGAHNMLCTWYFHSMNHTRISQGRTPRRANERAQRNWIRVCVRGLHSRETNWCLPTGQAGHKEGDYYLSNFPKRKLNLGKAEEEEEVFFPLVCVRAGTTICQFYKGFFLSHTRTEKINRLRCNEELSFQLRLFFLTLAIFSRCFVSLKEPY